MISGWTNAGFAASASTAVNATGFTSMEVGGFDLSAYRGSGNISAKAFDIRKVVVQLTSVAGTPKAAQLEVLLTWDQAGNQYVTDEPLTGTVQLGRGDNTQATAVIPLPVGSGFEVPPRQVVTASLDGGGAGSSRGVKMWAWVKLDTGTAAAIVRVITANAGN